MSLAERVDDLKPVDAPPTLKIFREKYPASCALCAADNEGIPEGEGMQTVQVDGGQNIIQFVHNQVQLRDLCRFSTIS